MPPPVACFVAPRRRTRLVDDDLVFGVRGPPDLSPTTERLPYYLGAGFLYSPNYRVGEGAGSRASLEE